MDLEDLNIAEDKQIDKFALDEECAKQPSIYQKYSEALADAEHDYDKAKNELAITEAELAHEMRVKGHTPQGVKVTEKSVAEAVLLDKKVKGCMRRVSTALHDVKVLKAAVNAIEHKKSMLSNLVRMYLVGYYQTDSMPISDKTTEGVDRSILKQLNEEE